MTPMGREWQLIAALLLICFLQARKMSEWQVWQKIKKYIVKLLDCYGRS
jgi:hypothetical protein